jgi:GAF domain-containing protein
MERQKKIGRYERIHQQLKELLPGTADPLSRMASVAAVLHHKMQGFFWTGFYLLREGKLCVGPYQGPLACQELEKDQGVCWAGINRQEIIIVPDVDEFPGHISCDSRSKSEIVVPVRDQDGRIIGVLDVDGRTHAHFDEVDAEGLERIVALINAAVP